MIPIPTSLRHIHAAFLLTLGGVDAQQSGPFFYSDLGATITITGCSSTAAGPLEIPELINEKPVTSIRDFAFFLQSGISSVTIPSTVTQIGSGAFGNCSALLSIHVDAGNPKYSSSDGVLFNKLQTSLIQCPGGFSGVLTVPASVSSIRASSFSYCGGLTSVTIPDSVTSIGSDAFRACTALTSVAIPKSITTMGTGMFQFCDGLASIEVDAQNPGYSSTDGVLFDKTQTTLIQYPGGKTGAYNVPATVTTIQSAAFSGCGGLTEVSLPPALASIGSNGFYRCVGLASVTLPSSVTSIGVGVFSECSGLASVTIPPSVTSIGASAFSDCDGLANVALPSSVTSIGILAFGDCDQLTSIEVGGGNPSYSSAGGVLFDKAQGTLVQCPGGLTGSLVVPDSVTTLLNYSFSGCGQLSEVVLPPLLTTIGSVAFHHCDGLRTVIIPSSTSSIGDFAFRECAALESVVFRGNAPSVGSSAFPSDPVATIYYFDGTTGFTSPTWRGCPSVNMGEQTLIKPWLISNGIPYDTNPTSDPDGDGVNLLLAYSLNLDPNSNPAAHMPVPRCTGDRMEISFHGNKDGITYAVESSTNMSTWTMEGVTLSGPDSDGIRIASVGMNGQRHFLRVAVSE